jgi:hypothetical protein
MLVTVACAVAVWECTGDTRFRPRLQLRCACLDGGTKAMLVAIACEGVECPDKIKKITVRIEPESCALEVNVLTVKLR